MDETIYVIFKVQFDFALEVWFSIYMLQGRRRLLESGTAIKHRWCPPSADGTRGERTIGGGLTPL